MLPSVPLRSASRWLGLAVAVVALALPAAAQRTVTLRMNSATLPDTIKADQVLAGAQVRGQLGSGTALPGGVIDWNSNTTVRPTNVGGDYWQVVFQIPDNDKLDFKFYFDQTQNLNIAGFDGWESGDNHTIPAGTGPVTLDLHYFNKTGVAQPYDWRPFVAQGDSIAVWFRVFMRTKTAVTNGYTRDDPALRVSLRGNFGTGMGSTNGTGAGGPITDWGSTAGAPEARLTRESGDQTRPGYDLYSGLVKYPASSAGLTQSYKFFFEDTDTNTDGRSYESGISDRTFRIPAAGTDTTLAYKFFSNSPVAPVVAPTLVQSPVTFAVDVSPLAAAGVFRTASDSIQVRGPFNDWGCNLANPDNCLLVRVPGSVTYAREIPISAQANTAVPYKYFVKFSPARSTDENNGYEEPLDFGGGDRSFTFTGNTAGQSLGTQFFNSIRANNVIAAGQTVNVGFEVDMRPALTFTSPRAFNPSSDQVTIFFQDPIWKITQGYSPVNDTPVAGFFLTDPDGDGIYTGSLPVRGPTYNGIGYQVAYGAAGGTFVTEGIGGTEPGRRRYRYVLNRTAASFQFGRDVVRPSTQPLPWEINPTGPFTPGQIPNSRENGFTDQGTVANEGGVGRAGTLQISALFPNPTTGIARMTVQTGEGEALTVRVYDVMGRLVTTAVENVRSAGEQTVQIDTQGLAAGLYVVRAESGTAVATRRLTVIR